MKDICKIFFFDFSDNLVFSHSYVREKNTQDSLLKSQFLRFFHDLYGNEGRLFGVTFINPHPNPSCLRI